ncbi:hypothetical protein J3R82DRAFT_2900, partial [Butyriboletus roseoflavus]
GATISSITYGITVSLYLLSCYLLIRERNRVEFKKQLPLLIFITVSFIPDTIFVFSFTAFTQMAFIDDRDQSGEPSTFKNNMLSMPVDDAGNAAFILLSDTLVV